MKNEIIQGKYGMLYPDEKTLINFFINNQNGMLIGYHLYNKLLLTTQVSKRTEILSNKLREPSLDVKNILIKKMFILFSEEVKEHISFLEVIENKGKIEDLNHIQLQKYEKEMFEKVNNETLKKIINVRKYSKETINYIQSCQYIP